jgi:putative transposase
MTSKPVSALLSDLGITRSHSRPRVSNDNPFSEAQFTTLKYAHDFPHHFDSLAEAKLFCEGFFTEYNHVHHHSGIGWHPPASVYQGTYLDIDEHRQDTLNRAFNEHPERFTRRPLPSRIRTEGWINEPAKETPTNTIAIAETV